MPRKLLGTMAGVALLGSVGLANAGQRATLTDAQLDKVTAGNNASVLALGTGVAFVGGFMLSATPDAALATITAQFDNVGAGTDHSILLQAVTSVP
jgi:hypothetical protein